MLELKHGESLPVKVFDSALADLLRARPSYEFRGLEFRPPVRRSPLYFGSGESNKWFSCEKALMKWFISPYSVLVGPSSSNSLRFLPMADVSLPWKI